MVSTAITLPLALMTIVALYDLARVYLALVFVQDVVLVAAKSAHGAVPEGEVPTDRHLAFIKSASGEAVSITNKRTLFFHISNSYSCKN